MSAERRTSTRAPVLGTAALLRDGEPLGSYSVVNASAAGLLLEGPTPPGLEPVDILLNLAPDRFIRGQAVVVRSASSPDGPVFGLSFLSVSDDAEDVLHDAVRSSLREARTAEVLVVDRNVEICQALTAALTRLGRRAYALSSPTEAVHLLETASNFSIALVDVVLERPRGRDVLAHLAEHHPAVRRVLIWNDVEPWQLERARHALGACPVDAVLIKPWSDDSLRAALG